MARRFGRRFFLHTAAGTTLGLPFLPSLMPRAPHAGGVDAPRRFVGILSMSGQFVTDWYPAWTPDGYQLRDDALDADRADGTTHLHETMPDTPYKWARLSDFAERGISNVLTTTLNPYLDKMLLLRGLDLLQSTSHGDGMFLGNFYNSTNWEVFYDKGLLEMPTIDQVLAYSDRFYPSAPRMRTLPLSTGGPSSVSFTD